VLYYVDGKIRDIASDVFLHRPACGTGAHSIVTGIKEK